MKNDYTNITPQSARKWIKEVMTASERRCGDSATKFQIRKMFRYIDTLLQYQVPMPAVNVNEDGTYFECPRCGQAWDTEGTGSTVDDFNGCPKCMQKWKGESDEQY